MKIDMIGYLRHLITMENFNPYPSTVDFIINSIKELPTEQIYEFVCKYEEFLLENARLGFELLQQVSSDDLDRIKRQYVI